MEEPAIALRQDYESLLTLFGEGEKIIDSSPQEIHELLAKGTMIETTGIIEWEGKSFKTNSVKNSIVTLVDFSNKKQNHFQVVPQGEIFPTTVMTYTIRYQNEGTVVANQAVLKISLSPHLSYLPNSTVVNGQPVTDAQGKSPALRDDGFALGSIAPGQGGEISLRSIVMEPLDDGTEISASGNIYWGEGQSAELEPVQSVVRSSPSFADPLFNGIEKIVDRKDSGKLYTFVVNFKNTGNANAYNARFKGELPDGWSYVSNSTCLNGRPIADSEGSSPLFARTGLFIKAVDAEEEGNFTFRAGIDDERKLGEFPSILAEAQGMEPVSIQPRE